MKPYMLRKTQKRLDTRKWLLSEKKGCDMSGDMPYCEKCASRVVNGISGCVASQDERVAKSLCAESYYSLKEEK